MLRFTDFLEQHIRHEAEGTALSVGSLKIDVFSSVIYIRKNRAELSILPANGRRLRRVFSAVSL